MEKETRNMAIELIIPLPVADFEAMFVDDYDDKLAIIECCLANYDAGMPLADIAEYFEISSQTVRERIKSLGKEKYVAAKERARDHRLSHSKRQLTELVTKNRKMALDLINKPDAELTLKEHCDIEKTFGKVVMLMEGEATERTDHQGMTFTVEMPPGFEAENL
jgi:DNA-binding MarR family transcriptional regulator